MDNIPINIKFSGKWKPLFIPQNYCAYVNDHTIFKDKSGNWRLLGTCSNGNYVFYKERFFIESVTPSLPTPMQEIGPRFENIPHRGIKISPHVFFDPKGQKYHLFFGPRIISHFVSDNGHDWESAGIGIKSLWPFLRDPHVIGFKDQYVMYCTDYGNKISFYESFDLYNWKKGGTALQLGKGVPKSINSACESAFVFPHNQGFILLCTIVPSSLNKAENYKKYNNTLAFYSNSPTNFGLYSTNKRNSAKVVATLEVHAPELISDQNRLFITTCGWKNYPKPHGVTGEGVFIREITIQDDL